MCKNAIILLLLFIVCDIAISQTPLPSGFPAKANTLWERIGYSQSDSGTIIAKRDTTFLPRFNGTIVFRPQNIRPYFYDSTALRWYKLFSEPDTLTTLATRYDLTQLIQDTGFIRNQFVIPQAASFYIDSLGRIRYLKVDSFSTFEPIATPAYAEGRLFYDNSNKTFTIMDDISGTSLQIGQEQYVRARNNTGSTINDGQVVYISGALGQNPTIALAQANSITTSQVIGLATHNISNNTVGKATTFGIVNDINTSAFNNGDKLYLSQSTPGGITNVEPTNGISSFIGVCLLSHATQGKIFVHAQDVITTLQKVLNNNSTLTENEIITLADSIKFTSGFVIIDSLRLPALTARADTTTYKPLIVDASGNVSKMTGWPVGISTVQSEFSVTGDGSSGSKLKLVNDASSPGRNKIYGTNYSSVKGYTDPDVAWYNIVNAGADNSGVVDASTYITSALAAGYKNIYLPDGIFNITSTVQLKDSVVIRGAGRGRTVIKVPANAEAFKATYALGGNLSQIQDLTFKGTLGGSPQRGVVIDSAYGIIINNVASDSVGGFAVSISNNGLLAGADYTLGNQITNCFFRKGSGGVLLGVRAEYNIIQSTSVIGGTYGIYINGGNNRVIGCNASENSYNLYLDAGGNDAHGTIVGCTFNHGGQANMYITGIANGEDITGCEIYVGDIKILNSAKVKITGCTIDADSIIVTNCTNTAFFGVRYDNTPNWSVTGNAPLGLKLGEGSTDGLVLEDAKNNKQFQIVNNNSIVSLGKSGGNTTEIDLGAPLVATGASLNPGVSISAVKARFDLGSTTGDGVQIYKTGSTGSALAVLDNSANYLLYAHPTGWVGIGNNNTRSGFSEILNVAGRTLLNGGIFGNKDSIPTITSLTSQFILVQDTAAGADLGKFKKILASNTGFATGNTLYTGDGTIPTDRTVTANTNTLTVTGSAAFADGAQFDVITSGSVGIAIRGQSTDGRGVMGLATTGVGVYGSATGAAGYGLFGISSGTGGNAIYGSTTSGLVLQGVMNPTSTSTVIPAISLTRAAQSAGANGIGQSIDFYNHTSTTDELANQLISKWTDATNATRTSQLEIYGVNSAASARKLAIAGSGQLTLDAYGSETFTGAPVKLLAETSTGTIIEVGGRNLQSGTTYTVLSTDVYKIIGLSNSAARTITLPAASAFPSGVTVWFKDEAGSAGTGNITINRAGSDTIDGATSYTISSNYGFIGLYSNGSNAWFVR